MAKKIIFKALDSLSPSEVKYKDLPRKPAALYNLAFNEYGQAVKRAGYEKYNTTSIGASHKITGMHRFYKQATSSKEFLVAWNTNWYKIAETDPWGATSIKASLTADADTFFETFKNHCYICNDEENLHKYNMTNVRTVGITVPSAAPTGTSPAGGSLSTGNYKVKYTYVDEDGYESNGSSASANIACTANDKITLAIVVSGDAKVTKRRIYRTAVGGSTYYYDKEVANNTDITVDLTQADSTLILLTVLHTDHTAPPAAPSMSVKRRSRMNLAVDENLYVSKLSDVEYFPAVYFPTGNGQNITGLKEQLITLPAFTEDSVERLIGTDKDNFEFRNAFSTEGCIAKRSLANCENLLVYLGFNGLFYFDGNTTGEFNRQLNEYIKANINYTYAHLSCATYFDNKYLICIPTGANTVPNITLYYDFKTRTSGIYSFAFSCFSKWDKGGDGLKLKGGSNTIGRIYSVLSGLDDDGAAITAYDDVEHLDFGKPEVYKNWWSVFYKIKTTTGTAFTFYYKLDNASVWSSATKTLTANTTLWYRVSLGPGGKRGRALKPKPYMSDKYYFEIQGLMVCYDEENFAEEKE